MMSTTLVTGATGLLGNNVVRALLGRGASVRVLVRDRADPRPLAGLDVEVRRGDVRDAAAVEAACRGAEVVVHAAAKVGIGSVGLASYREVNVGGTENVRRAVMRHGSRLIHVSTSDTVASSAHGEPADETASFDATHTTAYSVSKWEAEALAADAVIVNPGFLLGPWDWKPSSGRMLLAISRGQGLLAPRGHGSFVDARDVAAAILAAAERGRAGQRYLLTGERLAWVDAWSLFADVTGGRAPRGRVWPLAAWIGGRSGDLIAKFTGREPDVNSAALRSALRPSRFSSRLAEEELGFRRRPLRETVVDAWAWFEARAKNQRQ